MTSSSDVPAPRSIKELIIPGEQITMHESLGEGAFAVVRKGSWERVNGLLTDVALKVLRDSSPNSMADLRGEISHMNKLQHPLLVHLHGFVTNPPMMVFELCEGGSLLDRLRDDQKPIPLVSRLHDYCIQIAKALQFLESKHCVHRDVAARNILLAKDEKTLKISDFGLLRALEENEQAYTMASHKKVPFAWCPPEALRHRKFSHASDVWSYGVTIWEIFTFGEEPWAGCRPMDVLDCIDAGERLKKPKYCSERIYQIMKDCWKSNPADRCKFGAIREDLKATMFLDAIARENYNSTQPGTLQLVKGDEVVVVENTGQDWFGQNKKNQQIGTFPGSVVFAQTSSSPTPSSAATASSVTPRATTSITTAPPKKTSQRLTWKDMVQIPGVEKSYDSFMNPPAVPQCCLKEFSKEDCDTSTDCLLKKMEACLNFENFENVKGRKVAVLLHIIDNQYVCCGCHSKTGKQIQRSGRVSSKPITINQAATHLAGSNCRFRKPNKESATKNTFIFEINEVGQLFGSNQYKERGGRFDYRKFDALAPTNQPSFSADDTQLLDMTKSI